MSTLPEFVAYDHALKNNKAFFLERPIQSSEYLAWALQGAGANGDLEFIEMLLRHNSQLKLLDHNIALSWTVRGAAHKGHMALVRDLTSRGACKQFALMGAAAGEHFKLMEELIESGQILQKTAVYAYAISGQYGPMTTLLEEGAPLASALMGLGARHDRAQAVLIAQDNNLFWFAMGMYLSFHWKNSRTSDLMREIIKLMAEYVQVDYVREVTYTLAASGHYLSAVNNFPPNENPILQNIINQTVKGAAAGGFRTMVNSLINLMGAEPCSALLGAVEIPDAQMAEDLMELVISRDESGLVLPARDITTSLSGPIRVAFQRGHTELVSRFITYLDKRMLTKHLEKSSVRFLAEGLSASQPTKAVRNLAYIRPFYRRLVAEQAQVKHLLGAATIVNLSQISPEAALAFCQCPVVVMKLLLLRQDNDTNWSRLTPPLKYKILSFVFGRQLTEKQASELKSAAQVSLDQARLNLSSKEETVSLSLIHNRLLKKEKRHPVKTELLEKATDLTSRTWALCRHRTDAWPFREPFLPKSMKIMMERFPQYQNFTALESWLSECIGEIRFKTNGKRAGLFLQLYNKLNALQKKLFDCGEFDFDNECSDPEVLARYLQRKFDGGESLEEILRPLPYWRDLQKRFPLMFEVLDGEKTERRGLHC